MDTADLAKAAQKDVDAMLKGLDNYADGPCVAAYRAAAAILLKKTKADYTKMLEDALAEAAKKAAKKAQK